LASTIGAQYIELPGRHHNPWESDADAALAAMCSFSGVAPVQVASTKNSRVSIMMFTDVVESTSVADQLGDAAWNRLRRVHERIVTEVLVERDGTIVKFLGDGTLAHFSTATAALQAGAGVLEAVNAYNDGAPETPLAVRIGLNAGEPIEEDGDLHGASVNLAARVCAHAEGNTLLATAAVRHLATGKGFQFRDRGLVKLKGFAEEMRLYELLPSPSS
jgi:class 3 adenylate cyclase